MVIVVRVIISEIYVKAILNVYQTSKHVIYVLVYFAFLC